MTRTRLVAAGIALATALLLLGTYVVVRTNPPATVGAAASGMLH